MCLVIDKIKLFFVEGIFFFSENKVIVIDKIEIWV